MPSLVPKGSPDSRPLEVSDDAVEFWTAAGYVPAAGSEPKKSTTKTTRKASSSKSK